MYRWDIIREDESPMNPNSNSAAAAAGGVAPFVMKTYQMVSDPATDHLVSWGPHNNSFIVVDPLLFSHLLLPSHFKHSNFSSFIRQLNTYGFRKVDPDRWEFANEWFLRGQKQLLNNIVRKKNPQQEAVVMPAEEDMEVQIERMRRDQEEMDNHLRLMTRRLETTERRPEQMMDFLSKVVHDPHIFPRMMMLQRQRRDSQTQICHPAPAKKRRLLMTVPSPPSTSATATDEEEGSNSLGVASSSSDGFVGFICETPSADAEAIAPPYPFSLFGGQF